MSKTQQKNKSEIEHLRGENKRLKSENRQLRKQVNSSRKKAHFYEVIAEQAIEEVDVSSNCENCGKGVKMFLDLVHVQLEICDLCGHKETLNGKS